MLVWVSVVKSGDSENKKAVAAAYYWKMLFFEIDDFTCDRYGTPPNNLLNYEKEWLMKKFIHCFN